MDFAAVFQMRLCAYRLAALGISATGYSRWRHVSARIGAAGAGGADVAQGFRRFNTGHVPVGFATEWVEVTDQFRAPGTFATGAGEYGGVSRNHAQAAGAQIADLTRCKCTVRVPTVVAAFRVDRADRLAAFGIATSHIRMPQKTFPVVEIPAEGMGLYGAVAFCCAGEQIQYRLGIVLTLRADMSASVHGDWI